jgi:hypothetical protein
VIHAFGILHHIGLWVGMREVKRPLRSGGRRLFFEHRDDSNTIERFRPNEKHCTKGERPATWKESQEILPEFSRMVARAFIIVYRLRKTHPGSGPASG